MKNLKKVLALALAFAMSLTLFAGAAFTDAADIGAEYIDDVEMLVQLGVVNGYEDGSFKPQGNITRAEFAKMAYTLKYGYDDQGKLFAGQKSQFSDVEGNGNVTWAKGYINYCANQGIVGGVGGGKFNPNGNITVAEAAKMLLVILGTDATKEGYGGSNWMGNVTADAMELGVFDGWYGDPTQTATRELVCKLMRNTVFAPTYQYNPITGIGSQVSALDPNVKNETLGEKTMGLKHVEGIVVSNERYAIDKDPEGKRLEKQATVQPMDKAQVYYEIENSTNTALNGTYALLTINTDLSDEMLGTMVNVYFKADGNVGNYANVEIIGDVLTSGKTVAYDVMAADIAIMPDGESSSKSQIRPYIQFTTADGDVKTVNTRTEYDANGQAIENTVRVARNVKYNGAAFASRMYYSPIAASDVTAPYLEQPTFVVDQDASNPVLAADSAAKTMVNQMGENYMQMYRFVSVDGGATYSYIFRLTNIKTGKVGTYNDTSISISGAGTRDLEDEAVIIGEVSKGQEVVHYMMDGKLCIEPTEKISGKATNFKDGTATINGEIYRADRTALGKELDKWFTTSGNTGKNNENTQYTVFGNYVLDIDATAVTGNASDYAVILYSTYDKEMGTAKARFAFADNTEGVYEISKCYGTEEESNSYMKEFQNNNLVGALCRVNIVNGMADLSAEEVTEPKTGNGIVNVSDGQFIYDGSSYNKDANSIVYLLYGGEKMEDESYSAIKAKAYKLTNLQDANAEGVMKFNGTTYVDTVIGNAIKNTGSSGIGTLLVGAMTIGEKLEGFHSKTENIAYLLEAKRNYNTDTNKWYLDVAMISETGLIATRTIDDVRSDTGANIYFNNGEVGEAPSQLKAGTIVAYKLTDVEVNGEMVQYIESIGDNNGMGAVDKVYADPVISNGAIADGYYAVKVGAVEGELIGFFPYSYAQDGTEDASDWAVTYTMEVDEHDFAVVAIDDNNFVEDGEIETITESDIVAAGDYNAIIVVEGGAITRVFTLYNNF